MLPLSKYDLWKLDSPPENVGLSWFVVFNDETNKRVTENLYGNEIYEFAQANANNDELIVKEYDENGLVDIYKLFRF